jgi:hypothetical protein
MQKLRNNRSASGSYPLTTSEGQRVLLKVKTTRVKGSYCPRIRKHLYNTYTHVEPDKPFIAVNQ